VINFIGIDMGTEMQIGTIQRMMRKNKDMNNVNGHADVSWAENIKDQENQGTASDTMMNEQHLLPTGGRWVSLIR